MWQEVQSCVYQTVHISETKSVLTAVPQLGPACCHWAGDVLLLSSDILGV